MKMGKIGAILFFASFALLAQPIEAQVLNGDIVGEEQAGSWASYGLFHGSDQRFRASVINGGVMMMMDVIPPKCNVLVQFGIPFSSVAQEDIPSATIGLELRVDTGDIHNLSGFNNPVAMGDPRYIVYLRTIPDFDAMYAELKNGSTLWLKETLGSKSYYYTFPLNGFDTAFQRATAGCMRYVSKAAPIEPQKKSTRAPKLPSTNL